MTLDEQIKEGQKAIIQKQIDINKAQGELSILQNAQNELYLQQQLVNLGE